MSRYNQDPRKSPDNIVLAAEITQLREKHAKLSKELTELTGALDAANKNLTEGDDRIRSYNTEMAVHEKEMKEMQGHIFELKKRRAMAGTASGVEQEFNRQERLLSSLGAKQRELNKLLMEIESNTKLYEETMSDKTAVLQRLLLNLDDMQPKRRALIEEVSGLEAVAKIFIEAERLSGELGTLTEGITRHTTELNTLKAFIAEVEPETSALEAQIKGLEQTLAALEQTNREIKELIAKKSSVIEAVERLEEEEKSLSLDSGKLQRELDKQTETLKNRKAENETNRASAGALEKELKTYNEKIAEAKINLTKHGESKRKKDAELEKFENALASKLNLESELVYIEEGTAALGKIVRSQA
ncbi:hypothetical protein [Candidatus Magnetominusculus xianensis]|uniref:Magnetosome protein Man5 n=1 Tax=Candidatus Magnetominusculus xianensis TaxID=1748249 RepID=A0ABR5SJQ6_9BACT|nr:hypothetical protein [Candidatus Magnetominusculus xianensis]KWT94841.1 magnetosome protein Man5 [Candidatus Magnetominusculus xianensis]MBF0404733.1 hypothetical protein [Nitrospirota bacterium]